jgi:hypothetical protein
MSAAEDNVKLRQILIAGKISPPSDDEIAGLRELRDALRRVRASFNYRKVREADKKAGKLKPGDVNKPFVQKLLVDTERFQQFIEENSASMEQMGFYYEEIENLLHGLYSVSRKCYDKMDEFKGVRTETLKTTLFMDIDKLYSTIKGTIELGEDGPHYRFTKACVEYLDLGITTPGPELLRGLVRAARERRTARGGKN